MSLDQPEVPHALRHLGVEAYDLRLLRIDDPVRFAQVTEPADADLGAWRNRAGRHRPALQAGPQPAQTPSAGP